MALADSFSEKEKAAKKMYDSLDDLIKEDIQEAIRWAKETLANLDGFGHQFYVTSCKGNLVCCSFSKAEWPSDYCGRGMHHAAEAIAMAVCEYVCGY